MGQTSYPAEKALSETGGHQGLNVSVSLERCEAGSLVAMKGMTEAETGDTGGTGNRAEPGHRAETEVVVAAAAAAAAAAVSGQADFVPKVWAAMLLPAVLAVVRAAEAGQWVWLGGTESESAVGS